MTVYYQSFAGEISGAFGDFGTLVPILVSLSITNQINLTASLIFGGFFNIISGLYFEIPLPVQPMKSIAAVELLANLKNTEIASAGLSVATALTIFALTGAIKLFVKYIPLYIIRGIQLGTGMALILKGISSINASSRWYFMGLAALDNYLIAIIAFCLVMGFWKSRVTLSALLLFIAGMIIASTQVNLSYLSLGPRFWIPFSPSPSEFLNGFVTAGLGQIPLTISNSVIAVVVLAKDLFPEADFKKINVTRISLWVAFMNFSAVWFGSMPFCCGSGGLAAQYRFGSRTKFSVVFLGIIKIFSGLLFGSSIGIIFQKIPVSLIGILLVVAGFQISVITVDLGDFESKELREDAYLWYVFVLISSMIVTAVSIVGFSNDGVGFLIGCTVAMFLKWQKHSSGDLQCLTE